MSETLGEIIDKLFTIDMKMWNNQEILYKIRKMNFEEFKTEYFSTECGSKKLWEVLKRVCDINIQRCDLIDDIDRKIVKMIRSSSEELDHFIHEKHKTY